MTRLTVCVVVSMAALHAGSVKGVILDQPTGRPLARSVVRLQPIPGSHGNPEPIVMRSGRAGEFLFGRVPDGLYLLMAQRNGYFTASYGQRRASGQGTPIQVMKDSQLFAELRLRRMGAITGTVWDENGIGLPGIEVIAYRASLPLRSVGHAIADDRGVYRIAGLTPGRYWVRTAAHTLEDGSGLLPTYGPQSREIRDARAYEVHFDADTPDANIQPEPGGLMRLSGAIQCSLNIPGPVTVTLSSETGRRSMQTDCTSTYSFEGLAPMSYEVFATTADGAISGFTELFLSRQTVTPISLMPPPVAEFEVRNAETGGFVQNSTLTLMGRRDDLSALSKMSQIARPHSALIAGHWELTAVVGPGEYLDSVANQRPENLRPWRQVHPPEAHDVFIDMGRMTRIRLFLSDKAGQISGSVMNGKQIVPGSPVFLWPMSEKARRSLGGSRQTLSDVEGRYTFDGLPPGDYRVTATFDASEATPELMEEAAAKTIRLEPAKRLTLETPLWVAP